MTKKLIQQGAEAKIYLIENLRKPETKPSPNKILKSRTKKSYRHPDLDKKIRTRRTKAEAKILTKAYEAKINVPKIINTNKFDIEIEYLKGDKLSEKLNSYTKTKQIKTMQQLGKQTALLHKNNIIHGDLTTSNTILKDGKLYLIDFGLSFISTKIEDKAVDLHLIKQALEAKHFQNWEELFEAFKKGYKWQDSKKIIERLKVVEKRGRYKH